MMRKITKLMLTLAMLIVGVGANAITVKRYLRLSDTNLNTSFWQPHTVNPMDGTVLNESEGNNSSIAWTFSPVLDASNYTSLVVKLKSGAPAELKIRLYDGGGFWDGEEVRTSSSIAAGETSVTIDLTTIQKGNGESLSLGSLKYVEIHNSSFSTTTYTVDEIYFEKEIDADYLLLGDYTYGTLRAEHGYVTTSYGNDIFGWQYDGGTDWSAYKYLVVVPKKQYSETENEGVAIPARIFLFNKTSEGFGEEVELGWIANYNPKRARVFDLSLISGIARNSIGKLNIKTEYGVWGTWGLSAAYLTNAAPAYSETTWNGDDVNVADYKRTSTTKDAYGTVCLPYNAAVCGAEIYEVVGVDSKDAPSVLYMEQVDGILVAGKAYVYKTNSTLNVTAYRVGEDEVKNPIAGNLQGTFTGASVPENSYILVNGTWKKVTNANPKTVGVNKAYLTLTNSLVVPAAQASRYVTFSLDGGESTAIRSIENGERTMDGYFNLRGQRVDQPTKGIYIKNGKKVVIK